MATTNIKIALSHDNREVLFVFDDEYAAEKYRWLFPENTYSWVCAGNYYNAFACKREVYRSKIDVEH